MDMTASDHGSDRRGALRLHGMVARDIGTSIVSGRYNAGDILDGEIEASGRFHVSRTAYREAVRILAAKGLVEVRPKVGTRVTPRERWHLLDPDVLSWMFEQEPEDAVIQSLFELRRLVEPEAAALAAARRSEDQLDRMSDALERMERHTLAVEEGRIADQQFHAILLEAAGNPFLTTLTSGIAAAVAWTTIYKQRARPLVRDPVPDHVQVRDAIAAGDPDGARAAMRHLVDMALFDTTTAPRAKGARPQTKRN